MLTAFFYLNAWNGLASPADVLLARHAILPYKQVDFRSAGKRDEPEQASIFLDV